MVINRTVMGQFRQDLIGQLLTQFHPPLVETENIPYNSLNKDFMLIQSN
jgi:hypothetical protein